MRSASAERIRRPSFAGWSEMGTLPASPLLVLSAVSCLVLGLIVGSRGLHRPTHRAFVLLSQNFMLWSLGVWIVLQCHEEDQATLWIRLTFACAAFLPTTQYYFTCLFPRQRFEGSRPLLAAFLVVALAIAGIALSPYYKPIYIVDVKASYDGPPLVEYGPVFHAYGLSVALGLVVSFANLVRKLRSSAGIERRQMQHVILGIFLSTVPATLTNILGPVLHIRHTAAYGPAFMVIMVAFFAYAMIRYHLLDMWLIFSRTTVYAVLTGFVVVTFLGSVWVVHWFSSGGGQHSNIWSTVIAALVVSLVMQPLKERLQLVLDRTLVKRRYDMNRLLARISKNAAEIMRLDELLETVASDIRETVGVRLMRVLLVDQKDSATFDVEYSSIPGEKGEKRHNHGHLIKYMRRQPEPLVLEKLLRDGPGEGRAQIARHLAELDAYLCVPLKASSGLIGLLTLGQKTSQDIYSMDDLMVFTAVAGPLGTAIENARLYRKLEEANLHRARILTHMRGAVVAVDTDGLVSTVNRAARDLLGQVQLGQHYSSLVPEVAEVLHKTLKDERGISDFELPMRGPDGKQLSIVMSSSCLKTSDNEMVGAMVMIYDLTEIRRLEQNVQRADRLSSLGTLAAGMAHEIKNPLVSIKTFTQLLLTRYDDPDFRATFTEIVPHEVERIDSIVMRLLDFARPKPIQFSTHNLRTIVEEVLTLVENELRKDCINVVKD